jgi:ketosteroid isomerase-like protein
MTERHPQAVKQIHALYGNWMKAIRERNLEAIVSNFANHMTYMPPGRPKASGKSAVRDVWAGYLERKNFIAYYEPTIHVSEKGDMAYDIGSYRITMENDQGPATFTGKYVVVWELIDGQWKAVLDMDNSNG